MIHKTLFGFSFQFSENPPEKSGGGKPLALILLAIIVMVLGLITLYKNNIFPFHENTQINYGIPFKCTACNTVIYYHIVDLQNMHIPAGPSKGPLVLDCPRCGKHTLMQAVKCPGCDTIFIMKIDRKGAVHDICPQCGVSYEKAWKEKYRKESGD